MAGLEPARANYSPTDLKSVAEPNVDASSVRTTLVACPVRNSTLQEVGKINFSSGIFSLRRRFLNWNQRFERLNAQSSAGAREINLDRLTPNQVEAFSITSSDVSTYLSARLNKP